MFNLSYNGLSSLRGFTPDRYINAGIMFPLANVFSCLMTGHASAIAIALVNMTIACVLVAAKVGILSFSFGKSLHFLNQLDPLRVTAICTAIIAAIFLLGSGGTSLVIIQGVSFLAFSVGNHIQSSPMLLKLKPTSAIEKALLHPALWYGVGYTFIGLTIAGGEALLDNWVAALFTIAGIVEIIASLVMSAGKVVNKAGPFIGVTIGTLFLFAAGIATNNWAGAACALSAGIGELDLAIQTQQAQNKVAKKTGVPVSLGVLTKPLQGLMDSVGIPKYGR